MKASLLFVPFLMLATLSSKAQQSDKVWRPYDTVKTINRGTGEAPPEEKTGFDLNRVFVGGSVGLGLGFGSVNSSWNVGLFPQIGYSFADWIDAGVVINSNYNSQKYDYGNFEYKYTSFNYGTGAFLRLYPFKSFFVQAQPEINWTAYKEKYDGATVQKATVNSPSLLVGAGYGQRIVGESGFFTSIMFDVLSERYSPYLSYNGSSTSIVPIIRVGFVTYLGKGKYGKYNRDNY